MKLYVVLSEADKISVPYARLVYCICQLRILSSIVAVELTCLCDVLLCSSNYLLEFNELMCVGLEVCALGFLSRIISLVVCLSANVIVP